MKKYKIKKKSTLSLNMISYIIIFTTALTGLGYSVYRGSLSIKGTVHVEKREILSDTFENILQPMTVGGQDYTNIIQTESAFTVQSQELDGNILTINLAKVDTKGKERNVDLNFSLKNIGQYDYTNGTFNVQVTGKNGFMSSNPTVTPVQTILQGETKTLEVKFPKLKNNKLNQCKTTITIQYEINNKIEEFYIIVNFN